MIAPQETSIDLGVFAVALAVAVGVAKLALLVVAVAE